MTTPQQRPQQPEVELWLMNLPVSEARTWRSDLSLNGLESARARAFSSPAMGEFYAASVVFRRTVLGALLNLPPAEVCFEVLPGSQKPCLARCQNPADWRFNLSHSGECAVLALTQGRAVGVDIERMRGAVNWQGVAQTAFSVSEQAALMAVPPVQRLDLFYRLWTAKEAYLKACGLGLGTPLEAVSVAVAGPEIQVAQPVPGDAGQWRGQAVPLPTPLERAYRAAVVVQAVPTERFSIRLHSWTPENC